ncbi:MAG: ABC transporter ATP-binding protein [Anaerolineaceae bacterium]|nr:ABC transporter ATP-binding protein [Anaerolineaceae bacterium]
MIQAEQLSKNFDGFQAVNRVTFSVKPGEVLVLLGPNGAGKTTTVRMLSSILLPSSGSARIAGYDTRQSPEKVRANVGVLTEHHNLYTRMNAEEYLAFFARLYHLEPSTAVRRVEELLEQFDLIEFRAKRLGEYSKGMRQKLSLSRALIHEPPVLLLDEPTSAMDPSSARTVRDAILSLRSKERAIILCTHNLAEAEELADRIAIIQKGTIHYNDAPTQLKRRLLGPALYRVRLAESLNHWQFTPRAGIQLVETAPFELRVRIEQPEINAAPFLQSLLNDQLQVIGFEEVQQNLEQAYLRAISGEEIEA